MKKKLMGISLVVMLLVAAVVIPVAKATNKGPDSVTLDFNGKKKHVANFPHHDHQARVHDDCSVCHHKWDKHSDPKACKSCHGEKADGAKPKMKDAYHKRCKGCHKKEKKGPTKCKGCHGRK